MQLISIPYTKNITPIFNSIASFDWSIWLDSGNASKFNQKFDIISGFPYMTITANIKHTIARNIYYDNNLNYINSSFKRYDNDKTSPFKVINDIITNISKHPNHSNYYSSIPFYHGALGYFGYDLNQVIFKQLKKQLYNSEVPIMAIGIYAWALIYNHDNKTAYLAYDQNYIDKNIINNILELFSSSKYQKNLLDNNSLYQNNLKQFFSNNNFKAQRTKEEYKRSYNTIKHHIKNGNCYQVNYAVPFKLNPYKCNFNSWHVYQYLKKYNSNPFGCYFKINSELSILSFSPERFLKLENNVVTSEPIKGTRPNIDNNPELNQKIKQELQSNPKDRAENIMITDLIRNDLNKFCKPGSVQTTNICQLHSFPTVHHLISTINGQLRLEYSALDLLEGCFPGGSITGAPKISAMQIIQDLENLDHQLSRYVYCGSIGYINNNQSMDLSIAIRTSINYKQSYYYWAGGGIVADSNDESELDEVFTKLLRTE